MNRYLIVIICHDGYADQVMEVAKKHGARGGTVLRARGTASAESTKFFGINIQPEKDVIYIIADETVKDPIMKGVTSEMGATTPAHAISFALIVDEVVGLNNN